MSAKKLCPFKFTNPHLKAYEMWFCEGEDCAMWEEDLRCCALKALMYFTKKKIGNAKQRNK